MKLLFDRLSSTLEHALDFRLERGNVLSANLANADTPGYTPVEHKFDDQLADYLNGKEIVGMSKTNASHRGISESIRRGDVEYDYYSLPNSDGNSVDMDHEMGKIAQNQILYRATSKVYNKRMSILKYAIREGR